MKNLFVSISICCLLVLTNCTKANKTIINGGVQIRLENASNFTYKDILVQTNQDHTFANLSSGDISEYQQFEMAYKYAYIEITIDGFQYKIQPIDFIGETLLEEGFYTYKIDANSNVYEVYDRLKLDFLED